MREFDYVYTHTYIRRSGNQQLIGECDYLYTHIYTPTYLMAFDEGT